MRQGKTRRGQRIRNLREKRVTPSTSGRKRGEHRGEKDGQQEETNDSSASFSRAAESCRCSEGKKRAKLAEGEIKLT